MDEEWRLLIELDADGALAPVAEEIAAELGEGIGLHRAEGNLVAYADTPEAAHTAERLLRRALEQPEDDDEAVEPAGTGPRTVLVSLEHRHEAKQLADVLRNEGRDASSSWHTVEISTRSPEEAESLVAELDGRAPDTDVFISE